MQKLENKVKNKQDIIASKITEVENKKKRIAELQTLIAQQKRSEIYNYQQREVAQLVRNTEMTQPVMTKA